MKFDENKKVQEHFQVPEGYFEQFNARMMEMLPVEQPATMKVVSTKRRLWPRYAAAAAVAVVLAVSAVAVFNSGNDGTQQNAPKVAQTTTQQKTAPEVAKVSAEKPVLANAEVKKQQPAAVAKNVKPAVAKVSPAVEETRHQSESSTASYDQNEVDRASIYMCIDNQDVTEMLYETSF